MTFGNDALTENCDWPAALAKAERARNLAETDEGFVPAIDLLREACQIDPPVGHEEKAVELRILLADFLCLNDQLAQAEAILLETAQTTEFPLLAALANEALAEVWLEQERFPEAEAGLRECLAVLTAHAHERAVSASVSLAFVVLVQTDASPQQAWGQFATLPEDLQYAVPQNLVDRLDCFGDEGAATMMKTLCTYLRDKQQWQWACQQLNEISKQYLQSVL